MIMPCHPAEYDDENNFNLEDNLQSKCYAKEATTKHFFYLSAFK